MLSKIYFSACAFVMLAAAVVLAVGKMTEMAWVVFGFIGFGMIFMGMISVLPSAVHDWIGKH